MARTVWKYTLAPETALDMPRGAEVLSVREQGGDVCLWALVDPDAPKEPRRFVVAGTGHALPDGPLRFRGSAHLDGGALVFHVFEREAVPPREADTSTRLTRSARMVPLQRISGRDPREDYVAAFAHYLAVNAGMEFGAAVAVADTHPTTGAPEADAEAWLARRDAGAEAATAKGG